MWWRKPRRTGRHSADATAILTQPVTHLPEQISIRRLRQQDLDGLTGELPFLSRLLELSNPDDRELTQRCFGRRFFLEIWPSLEIVCRHCNPRNWETGLDNDDRRNWTFVILDNTEVIPVQYQQSLAEKLRSLSTTEQYQVTHLVQIVVHLPDRELEIMVYQTKGRIQQWLGALE